MTRLKRYLVLLALTASAAYAADPQPVAPSLNQPLHARAIAMGGAYESMGFGADAVIGNPAAMTLYRRYVIEVSGNWDIPLGYGTATFRLADSTSALAAGVAYDFVAYGGLLNRRWGHLVTGALAFGVTEWLHIGIAVRNFNLIGATATNAVTINGGIVFRPGEWLQIGFSGHNLLPSYNVDVTRYLVASASSTLAKQLTLAFDANFDFNASNLRMSFHGGAEWLIAETVPLRAGYEWDGILGHQYFAVGTGYFNKGSGIDIAYRNEIGGSKGRLISLTLKLQF